MKRKTIINVILSSVLALGVLSCTKMDDYKKISGDKEIVYPGKISSVKVIAGDGRLMVEGVCNSDPKIVSCRIYWSLGTEYVEVPVDMSTGSFKVNKEISLVEGVYNFDVYTYDAQGNRSVPVNISGKSYGRLYKLSITNRLLKSFTMQNGKATMEWWGMDTTMGPIETEIMYTNAAGEQVKIVTPVAEAKTVLEGYVADSEVSYTTIYKPEESCVDVFYSQSDVVILQNK